MDKNLYIATVTLGWDGYKPIYLRGVVRANDKEKAKSQLTSVINKWLESFDSKGVALKHIKIKEVDFTVDV